MQRRIDMKERDDAISPVIAVMLMLVVTIIIAAVVSGFAGGLVGSQTTAPSASFDVSLTDDSLSLAVQSLSEPIPSKDISIVLSGAGGTRKLVPGASTVPFGFNIVEPPIKDKDGKIIGGIGFKDSDSVGTENIGTTQAGHADNSVQWFGNYTLNAGSRMSISGTAFTDGLEGADPLPEDLPATLSKLKKGDFTKAMTKEYWKIIFGEDGGVSTTKPAVMGDNVLSVGDRQEFPDEELRTFLGTCGVEFEEDNPKAQFWATAPDKNWRFGQTIIYGDGYGHISVSPGDRVTVTIVHTPSGQTMFMKTVTVKEA